VPACGERAWRQPTGADWRIHEDRLSVIVTGSIAFDFLMKYPGHFAEHILLNETGKLSVSFLVEEKQMHRGGCGPNIAYSLALLGQNARLMGTAGQDFPPYATWLEERGVDTSLVTVYPEEFTSTYTVMTDLDQNQIAGFHAGAMSRARELSFERLDRSQIDLVIISPNDPQAMDRYASECQRFGIPFIYDPSQQLARLSGEQVMAAMQGAKALTVNDYELELVKQKTGLDEAALLQRVDMLVVTRGADGASLMSRERRVDVPIATPQVVADPTGVGDAFRGGLIAGLVRGYCWEVTGRLGALAATYALEQCGTMNHSYTLPEFVQRYARTFGDTPELADLLTSRTGSERRALSGA
jgi:adenosine kinase